MHSSSSRTQPVDDSDSKPALLPQYGFGATYTFDALVELHPFLYRVHTPKHRGQHTSSLAPSRATSPFRPALSRSPSSLSASIASIRSTGSTETDIDDAAPGDPYFLSRRFRNDLSSPDPGTRRRTLSTLSSLSGGSGSGSYTYVDSEYDFSDGESEAGTAVSRVGLTRSTSMMFSPARKRVESLTAVRPGHKRSMSVGQVIMDQKRPVPPSPLKHVENTTATEPGPEETAGAQMTYADLVRHLDWTTRAHSPYVTTSFSFFWALWEAVRRYRLGVKHDVEIAVIDARRLRDRARTALEVLRGVEGERQDKAYWKWYRSALEAQDVLVFGAIPGDAIYASIPLTQLLPVLPDYFFRVDPSTSIPSSLSSSFELQPHPQPAASQAETAELDEDPRSPTARQAHPLFFPSTPVRIGTAPSTPSLTASQKLERASTAVLFSTLAWDIGTSLKPLRRSSKVSPSASASASASPSKEKRHTSHRTFCHALTQAFLSPARTHDACVSDSTAGVVRLAEVLLGPWVRARCAEGAAMDAFGMGDEEDEDEDELDRSMSMSGSFLGERAGSECLGLAGDGCTLEHSHTSFPSISSSPSASLDADADSHAITAQHDAASVLSELADALARWPAAWWAAEHAEEVGPKRAEAVRRCVGEAARSVGVGIEREQGRVDLGSGVGRRGSVGSVGSGSTYEKWASLSDDGDDDERRGRGETRARVREAQKVGVGAGAGEKTKTRPLRGWPPAHSPSHSPSPAPHRPRARSPLGTSPALLGPAIVLRSGGGKRDKDMDKDKDNAEKEAGAEAEKEDMTDSFESDLSKGDSELARSRSRTDSLHAAVATAAASESQGQVPSARLESESSREKSWAPSTPPPTPPLHGVTALQEEDAEGQGRRSSSPPPPPPPPPRSRRRPVTVPVSTPESESVSTSTSSTPESRSLPGGWADAEGDRDGSRLDDDFFRSPRTQSQSQSQPQLLLQRRPFSWAGTGSGSGSAEFTLSSYSSSYSPLGGSRTSSVESLRGRGESSPSLVPSPSPSFASSSPSRAPSSSMSMPMSMPMPMPMSPSPSPSPMRSRTVSASRSQGPGPGQAAILGLEYVDARMGLLAEVVSSVLGVGASSGAGSGSGELRLDTSSAVADAQSQSQSQNQAQIQIQGQGQAQAAAARPHGLVHHRRHSSQLEQELSPVREEMEDEGEGRGGFGVSEEEEEEEDAASEAAATEGGLVEGDEEGKAERDVDEPVSASARALSCEPATQESSLEMEDMPAPNGVEGEGAGSGSRTEPAPAMSHASRSRKSPHAAATDALGPMDMHLFDCLRGTGRDGQLQLISNPLRASTLAKQGSLPHSVMLSVGIMKVQRQMKANILNGLCKNLPELEDALDPALDAVQVATARQMATALIIGVGSLCDHLRVSGTGAIVTVLLRYWNKLLSWVRHLYDDRLLPGYSPRHAGIMDGVSEHITTPIALRHVGLFMWSTLGLAAFLSRMPSDTRTMAFDLVAHVWLLYSWERVPGLNLVVARLLNDCTHDAHAPPGLMSDCLLRAADGDAERVANAVFRRLLLPDPIPVPTFNSVVNMTATLVEHPVLDVLQDHPHWVGRISKAAARMIRFSKEQCDVRVVVVNYLGVFMRQAFSYAQLLQAVKAGLLQAIIDGGPIIPLLSGGLNDNILDTIKDDLSLSLVFHSMLTTSIQIMKRIRPDYVQKKITRGPLKKEWNSLSRIILERAALKKLYSLGLLRGSHLKCDQCTKRFRRGDIKRCAGCMFSLYCSKRCQTSSWKTGHRERCSSHALDVKKLQASDDIVLNSDEHAFLRVLALTDVRRHAASLKRLAAQKFPGTHISKLAVTTDYSHYPPVLKLFRAKDLTDPDVENGAGPGSPGHSGIAEQAARVLLVVEHLNARGFFALELPSVICVDVLRGAIRVRIALAPLLDGVFVNPAALKDPNGKLKDVVAHAPRRSPAMDESGQALEPCFDEVDEVLRRMRIAEKQLEGKGPRRHPWEWLEEVSASLADPEDWPFVVEEDYDGDKSETESTAKDDDTESTKCDSTRESNENGSQGSDDMVAVGRDDCGPGTAKAKKY
ncbi:hypothetical protein M0805_002571 [Coniferiporia weirii]|nr:hypothetical protein M0805_002571 [Coniferiporia weirii]